MELKNLKFDTNRCFGVEIEVGKEVNRDLIINFIKSNTHRYVKKSFYRPTINNSYWDVKHDGSCGAKYINGINEGGFEINSYKASGVYQLKDICYVISKLKTIGVKVNSNCGFHVHVEVSDFDTDDVGTLLNNWIYVENMIFSCVPKKRKDNKYCQRIAFDYNLSKDDFKKPIDFWNLYKPKTTTLNNFDRKRSLNINNYYRSISLKKFNRKTIEFRFMESTLCEKNIKNWVRFLVHFVGFCKNRKKIFHGPFINDVEEFLNSVGLGGLNNGWCLSPGLLETRKWVLQRLSRHGTIFKKEAKLILGGEI
jgi:hypothetical protein